MGIRAVVRRVMSARSARQAEPETAVVAREPGWKAALRRLDEQYPNLSNWLGGRLDIEIPAILVSVGVHLGLLLSLATVGYAVHAEAKREWQSRAGDLAVDTTLTKMEYQDLDMGNKPLTDQAPAGTFAPNLAPTNNLTAPPASAATTPTVGGTASAASPMIAALNIQQATKNILPTATLLGQQVSIKGDGAEHVGGVDGAVDRVANEIVRRLEKGRTLVIWAFDASGSLVAERERLATHIETVYGHVLQLDKKELNKDDGLLTMVTAFGHDRKLMTPAPTADKDEIIKAIRDVPLDETGVESTFQTVLEVVRKYSKYKDKAGNVYHTMVVVVTDEVGDDDKEYLEPAIDVATKAKVPVYVLGSQAIFGRLEGYMDYTDPKTKKTYHNLPVRQGPESFMLEQVKLPFWYAGYQYDILDSGFGPYALSRLAGATGGIYFITRMGGNRMGFDPAAMREYKPDWVSEKQYEAGVMNSPIRKAVMEAALVTQQQLPGQPGMNFPPADEPAFKDEMARQQAVVARIAYTVDAALELINPVAKYRDKEPSRRWQAHFDLVRGRLLAMKIRCYEYNFACAAMKKDAPKFKDAKNNAWKLAPSEEIRYSDKAADAAKAAKTLLDRVVHEHPGTPWSLLAQRELKDPFGFKWVETYVKPEPKGKEADEAAKKKKAQPKNMPKPPDPPKL